MENSKKNALDREIYLNLAQAAAKQLFTWPHVESEEKLKRMIKKYILFRKVEKPDRFSWPNALLAKGLLSAYRKTEEAFCLEAVQKYLEMWIEDGCVCNYVDNAMNASLLLELYDIVPSNHYLEKARETAELFTEEWKRTADGSLVYRRQHPETVFADTVGMISPLLCRYGDRKNYREARELGCVQIKSFLENGMDASSGLPYHGYNLEEKLKYGIIGWGRAVGWILLGMADSIPFLAEGQERKELENLMKDLCETACSYQKPDGFFPWQLSAMEGPSDSSATAMITYGVKTACELGILPDSYAEAAERAQEALISVIESQGIGQCSGECMGFAEYPQRYGVYPWSTGPALCVLEPV